MRTLRTWGAMLVAVLVVAVAPMATATPIGAASAGPSAAAPTDGSLADGASIDPGSARDGRPIASAGSTASAQVAQQEACSFPATVTDATSTEVTLQQEPERIVVLAPSDAQTLWAIGARENVVGMPIDQYTAYLNGTQDKTDVVGDDGSVDVEQVVGLQPDVVFAASVTPNETVEQLRQAGLTVYSTGLATSIEDVYGVTERYGRLVGNCEDATETVREMRTRVNTIEDAVNESTQPQALYYFFNYTAGQGTHINDVLQTAGARNIAAQAGITGYKPINPEIVASRNPEWIVHPDSSSIPQGQPYSTTAAFERNQTVALNSNLIQQPAPRIVYPLTKLARALHPEAMSGTNLSSIDFSSQGAANATTEQPVAADGGANGTTGTGGGGPAGETIAGGETGENGTTTEASGPGFGLAGAVGGLLVTGVLVRRRR